MKLSHASCLIACTTQAVNACQKEQRYEFHAHRALAKRQETSFPPQLTAEESILLNSFDNRTIEEW